jgi:hypothetical protein
MNKFLIIILLLVRCGFCQNTSYKIEGNYVLREIDSCGNKINFNSNEELLIQINNYNFFKKLLTKNDGFFLIQSKSKKISDSSFCKIKVYFQKEENKIKLNWPLFFKSNNNFELKNRNLWPWMVTSFNSNGSINISISYIELNLVETNLYGEKICFNLILEKD